MKKAIFLLIILSLVLFGCSDNSDSETSGKNVGEVITNGETNTSEDVNANANEDEPKKTNQKANIEETIIFDNNDILVTAKSINYDGWIGPELKLLIENESDKNIIVQARYVSVNGIMIESLLSSDVSAGKKANDNLILMSSSLETAGITTISELEFVLHIIDSDDWMEELDSEPIFLKTDATDFIQDVDDSGVVAYNDNGIKIIAKKLESEGSFWGADLFLFIENDTDQDITVQARNASINGFMVEPYFSCNILKKKKAFDTVTFLESDLSENDITDIEEIELSFHIFETNTWKEIKETENIKIRF